MNGERWRDQILNYGRVERLEYGTIEMVYSIVFLLCHLTIRQSKVFQNSLENLLFWAR